MMLVEIAPSAIVLDATHAETAEALADSPAPH